MKRDSKGRFTRAAECRKDGDMSFDIENLTVRELREVTRLAAGLLGGDCRPTADPYTDWIGKNLFVRTVTHHYTGRLVAVYPGELVIEDAAWIADDGRLADALAENGEFRDIEPYPDGRLVLGRGAILDVTELRRTAPRTQR